MQSNISSTEPLHAPLKFHVSWVRDPVIAIDPEAPLWEAVQLMKDHQVGDVVVMDRATGRQRPIGMITDRDIALCLGESPDYRNLKVNDVMSRSVVTASLNDDLFKIIQVMKEAGVTRLPLLDAQGAVAGVVTAKNILQILVNCFFDVTQISARQQENEIAHQH